MKVLVCGGREYGRVPKGCPPEQYRAYSERASKERFLLESVLDGLITDRGLTDVIHGAAPGADMLAHEWANKRNVRMWPFPADWKGDGKAAGPIRNKRMIDEGKPNLVVAFPGGTGTANMVALATTAGVEVMEIPNYVADTTGIKI